MDPLLFAAAGWVAGWWLWGRPAHLRGPRPADRTAPRPYAVVIPARDEAEVLPALLDDLAADPDPLRRVFVVDDHSADDTAAIAQRHQGVTVVDAPTLPAGWTGKNWACATGVRCAEQDGLRDDETVVFVDADVRLGPGSLRTVVDDAVARGGVVSVQPFHATRRPYEQLSLFCGVVSVMGTGAGQHGRTPTGAFGPVLATSLADYRQVGGHEAVRSEVAEDLALGLRYRDAGLPVAIRLGHPAVRYRMYPAGVRQLIEGWTKNMATGASAIPLTRSLLTALWIAGAGATATFLPHVPGNGSVSVAAGLAIYAAFVVQVARFGRGTGTFGLITAVLYPIPLLAFMALFLRSTWRLRFRRSVSWRGRSIPVGGTGLVP